MPRDTSNPRAISRALRISCSAHQNPVAAQRNLDVSTLTHAAGLSATGDFDLLSAFAREDLLARATAHAQSAGYLCHEFGDSTLIARSPAAHR